MKRNSKWLGVGLAVAGLAVATTTGFAGTNFWDLNDSSVTNELIIRGTGPDGGAWRQEVGGNGLIQITAAVDGQSGAILFPDADDGLVVKAFTFEAKIKLGDGENPPADGFSLNYASSTDPVVTSLLAGNNATGWAGSADNGGTETNLPEEGTTTGLAIGFDTWGFPGGGNGADNRDLRGISIRVNGSQVAQIPMPNLLVSTPGGDPNDPTSLETGFPDEAAGNTGTNLLWAPLRVTLDELGVINVFWKGSQVLTNYQSQFFPIPGRIVFGGRTGGNNAIQWVDDIALGTIPSTTFLISGLTGNAEGFTVTVNDAAGSQLDPTTIELSLNSVVLPSASYTVSKVGNVSSITYSELPDFFPAGSTNLVSITAEDNNGTTASLARPFVVRPYIQLDPSWIAPPSDYNTSDPGFIGNIHQIGQGRGPGDANNVWNAMRHLAGGYLDASGTPLPNLVDPIGGTDANGNFEFPDGLNYIDPWINFNQDVSATPPTEAGSWTSTDGPSYGDYPIPGIPGTTLGTDNIVAQMWTYLNLTGPNLYTFVFNSDDGFRVSFGPDTRSAVFTAPGGTSTSAIAGQFNGGKGSSDIQFDVAVPAGASGVYLTRALWWEGGGGANAEFFSLLDGGSSALVGDTAAGGVAAYKPSGASVAGLASDIVSAAPWPGQTGVAPDFAIQVIIADGSSAVVDANSIVVRVNGAEPPKTTAKVGANTRVTIPPNTPNGLWTAGAVHNVEVDYTAGGTPKSADYSFTVINYPTLPPALATAPGTGTTPGMKWRTYQTAAGHGTTIAGAENVLAGGNGPDISDPNGWGSPRDGEGFFTITDWINFDQAAAAQGNFTATAAAPQNVPDEVMPGIPGTTASTDNIAAECLTYLELEVGFHRMVVNSDDGFLVTTGVNGALADQKYLNLGQFDGGRGASDTLFFFNVEQAGVYFFRLLWFEGGGGANVEWFTVNANGTRALVNGEQTGSIPAFQNRSVAEPEIPVEPGDATFAAPVIANGQVTLSWTGTGTLQESTDLVNWGPSPSQANPQNVTPTGDVKAYRILVSP